MKTLIVGGVMFLGETFVIPLLFVLAVILHPEREVQFQAPGTMEITVTKPGRYYLWNDFRTLYNGRSYDRSKSMPDGFEIGIQDAGGHPLKFVTDTSIFSSRGASAKSSIGYVELEHLGKVTVHVTGGDGDRILSFSQSGIWRMFGLFLGAFGLSAIVALTGIGLVVWGLFKSVRANRVTRTARNAPPPYS